MPPPDDEPEWTDLEAGPIVRPYALTGGRTRPGGGGFDLMAVIETAGGRPAKQVQGGPEHHAILRLCGSAPSVAEVAAELDLPVDVVRVLLGDLADQRLITVRRPAPVSGSPSTSVL